MQQLVFDFEKSEDFYHFTKEDLIEVNEHFRAVLDYENQKWLLASRELSKFIMKQYMEYVR